MQVRKQFDKETREKLFRSFGYATLSGISAGLTVYSQTKDVQVAVLSGLSALISFFINVPIQYYKGEDQNG